MATHGIATARQPVGVPILEHAELEWSKWFRCETSFNLMLVPQRPGIYAIAEEVRGAGAATGAGKRILTVHQFAAEDDLARALGRLFTPASPFYERVIAGRCFLRYAVAEDAEQRASALAALQSWLAASAESAATDRNSPQGPDPAALPAGF